MRAWMLVLAAGILLIAVSGIQATAAGDRPAWYDQISISGYFQNRYEARQDTVDDFFMRRLYVNLVGRLNDRTTAVVVFGRVGPEDPNIDLSCAFVDYQVNDEWMVRVGQVPTNFGWDTAESSSKRLPLERFVGAEGIPTRPGRPGIRGMYFAGPWDRGIYLIRKPVNNAPKIIFGVVNGNFRLSSALSTATSATLMTTTTRPSASTSSGASPGGSAASVGWTASSDPAPTRLTAMRLTSTSTPTPARGASRASTSTAASWVTTLTATPFVRYEVFDPNKSASGDTYTGLHIGCAYQLDKHNEITVEWVDADQCCTDYGQFGLQWQLAY